MWAIFLFFQLCKMYEEYLEELFNYSLKLIAKTVKKVVNSKESQEKKLKEIKGGGDNEKDSEKISEEMDLLSNIHFHTSVFLIWLLTSILYVPSLQAWAKNHRYSILLEKDPSAIPSIIVCACGAVLWQSSVPKKSK
mgnify:CR=1 FL=1